MEKTKLLKVSIIVLIAIFVLLKITEVFYLNSFGLFPKNQLTNSKVLDLSKNKDYKNLQIFLYSNSKFSQTNFNAYNVSIKTDEKRNIFAQYELDGNKQIKEFNLTSDELDKIISYAGKIIDFNNGTFMKKCDPTSEYSIKVIKDSSTLLNSYSYNCDGKATNKTLEMFFEKIKNILPF